MCREGENEDGGTGKDGCRNSPSLAAELATANQQLIADLLQRGLRDLRIEQVLERSKRGGSLLPLLLSRQVCPNLSLPALRMCGIWNHHSTRPWWQKNCGEPVRY